MKRFPLLPMVLFGLAFGTACASSETDTAVEPVNQTETISSVDTDASDIHTIPYSMAVSFESEQVCFEGKTGSSLVYLDDDMWFHKSIGIYPVFLSDIVHRVTYMDASQFVVTDCNGSTLTESVLYASTDFDSHIVARDKEQIFLQLHLDSKEAGYYEVIVPLNNDEPGSVRVIEEGPYAPEQIEVSVQLEVPEFDTDIQNARGKVVKYSQTRTISVE